MDKYFLSLWSWLWNDPKKHSATENSTNLIDTPTTETLSSITNFIANNSNLYTVDEISTKNQRILQISTKGYNFLKSITTKIESPTITTTTAHPVITSTIQPVKSTISTYLGTNILNSQHYAAFNSLWLDVSPQTNNEEFLFSTFWNCSSIQECCNLYNQVSNTTKNVSLEGKIDLNCTQLFPPIHHIDTTLHFIAVLITAIILGIIILATIIGNVFVIAAILLERNLQSVANYLILSLAVADLLVACLVMPLSAVYEVSKEWKLGPELCDMWTSCDVLCCTASILHLVAIALDRYWAVTNIDYIHQRTAKRIGIMILIIWALSFLVSIAPLLGWKDPKWDHRVSIELQCIVSQDVGYQLFATASSFYVPLLVILVLYWRIFQAARKRIRRRQKAIQTHPKPLPNTSHLALTAIGFRWKVSSTQQTTGGLVATAAGGSGGIAAAVVTVIGRPLPTISETTTAFTNISSTHTSPEKCSYDNDGGVGDGDGGVDRIENDLTTMETPSQIVHQTSTMSVRSSCLRKKNQISADSKRERKAAKTLAIITGAFVFCWLPFFILAILSPTCQCNISPLAMSLTLWLGYFNSTLNPIIYTIFSPEFRHAFKRLLCGRRNSIRRRTRCISKR